MNHRPVAVRLLIVLQFLLGFGAFVSGGLLVAVPDGSLMQMPVGMLQYSPFSSFLIPGIILSTLLGIYPMAVSFLHILYFIWGWVLILLTLVAGVRRHYTR